MDEVLDYLLWKHHIKIYCGVCMLCGFALGSAPGLVGWDKTIMAACALLAAIVAMIIMFRRDQSRDYTVEEGSDYDRE